MPRHSLSADGAGAKYDVASVVIRAACANRVLLTLVLAEFVHAGGAVLGYRRGV